LLGSLIEKEITTPEYYPLTLNSLMLACNQKNNRHPVTSLTEAEVEQALNSLRDQNLAYVFHGSTSRVPKYKHVMTEVMHLNPAELAVMCALMLSGAQTIGEIRGRGGRLHNFSGLEEVEQTLHLLTVKEPEKLATRLPRQPGQKEARYAHLLCGEIDVDPIADEIPTRTTLAAPAAAKRDTLESRVETLTAEVENLKQQFEEFKKQFE